MNKPDFLIIPMMVLEAKKLQPNDKFVYGAIYWYTKLKLERCIASNKIIAELVGCSENAVSHSITRLNRLGFIKTVLDKNQRKEIIPQVLYSVRVAQMSEGGSSNELHIKKSYKEEKEPAFKKAALSSKNMNKYAQTNEDGTTGEIVDLNGRVLKTGQRGHGGESATKKPRFSAQAVELLKLFEDTYIKTITTKPLALNVIGLYKKADPFIKKLGIERMKELCVIFLTTDNKYYRQVAWSPYIFLTDSVIHELNAKN